MCFLAFILLCVSYCNAAHHDQKMYDFFHCTSNHALIIGNELIAKKQISEHNSIYQAYKKLVPILSFKEKPSDAVMNMVNTVLNPLIEQYSTSYTPHEMASKKLDLFNSAATYFYENSTLAIPQNKVKNIHQFKKLVIKTYLDNNTITSETERDTFIALILLGIKINLILSIETII